MDRTIVALATPPGIGGLAVIRISGDYAIEIADKVFKGKKPLNDCPTHTIHYGNIESQGLLIDKITASIFREPHSYTGENVVELGCHGGQLVAEQIINLLLDAGAHFAEPGEFTRRAFLNGKLDLAQVEAVADIIHSNTVAGVKTAARQLNGNFTKRLKYLRTELLDIAGLLELELDFSDEGIELIPKEKIKEKIINAIDFSNGLADSYLSSEIMRSGFFVGIVGYPNSGKSTLFNRLIEKDRAIVSPIPGTTRDYLEESLFIKGITIRLFDTAGLRSTSDIIEIEGIKIVDSILKQSNLILVINDITYGREHSDSLINKISLKHPTTKILIAHNKIDLVNLNYDDTDTEIFISAFKNIGLENLKHRIYDIAKNSIERESDILINQRHANLLKQASLSLSTALESLDNNMENEFIAIDIRKAVKILGELTGETWNEEVLDHIFSRFCIGK